MTHLMTKIASVNTTLFKATVLLMTSLIATPSFAADSANHASKAGKHSALAVSHGASSTAKVASAVVAVPLIVTGSVMYGAGTLSSKAGNALMVNASEQKELTVTDLTITADAAPAAMMKNNTQETKNTINMTKTTTTQKTITMRTQVKEEK